MRITYPAIFSMILQMIDSTVNFKMTENEIIKKHVLTHAGTVTTFVSEQGLIPILLCMFAIMILVLMIVLKCRHHCNDFMLNIII